MTPGYRCRTLQFGFATTLVADHHPRRRKIGTQPDKTNQTNRYAENISFINNIHNPMRFTHNSKNIKLTLCGPEGACALATAARERERDAAAREREKYTESNIGPLHTILYKLIIVSLCTLRICLL